MDRPSPNSRLPWHCWPAVLVLCAGLLASWSGVRSVSESAVALNLQSAAEQHYALANLLQGQIRNLLDGGQQLARTAPATENVFRSRATAYLASFPGVAAAELVRARDDRVTVLWSVYPGPKAAELTPAELPESAASQWQSTLAATLTRQQVSATARFVTPVAGRNTEAVGIFFPAGAEQAVFLLLEPDAWLRSVFSQSSEEVPVFQVHDLSQHSKSPLFATGRIGDASANRSFRSEIVFADRRWMVTSAVAKSPPSSALTSTLLAGLVFTLMATVITGWLCRRLAGVRMQAASVEEQAERLEQQKDNALVEKAILRQALNDSEERSRDLVELSGGAISELDEHARIGFISPQIAGLLGRTARELSGSPFANLITHEDRANFQRLLESACRDRQVERMDLHLLATDDDPIPATLRVKALTNPLHGFTGYRLSLQRRHH